MNHTNTATLAAKGLDTEDFLDHIAWTDVILPALMKDREALTRALVDLTLRPPTQASESREQLAGKIFGIDHVVARITKIVKDGHAAGAELASHNLYLTN